MKPIILGTAGHIDHGKTSLVKALSGTDTDRLKEEKQRGITIELGFAAIDLPSGLHIGIVDVPGHEKFVKNMVAGASGIDVVALIIAADEGVMPQTREHMEICTLLGVEYGFVVLTKIDMVDAEWLELVTEDVREFMEGTFLESAPIVSVSSLTGEGIPQLLKTIDDYCRDLTERPSNGLFRLPVDRVFTIKGFGTVITGTLISGHIDVGETIMIYPSKITSKVRGLQVHDKPVEKSEAGLRTAINFQGVEKNSVNRGDILARPDSLVSSYMVDVELMLLKSCDRPLKNREKVRFHIGTSLIPCNIILLDREKVEPGETALVQLRLDYPVACIRDDRFVIRSFSPVRTLGGGRILNPFPQKHKRFKEDTLAYLRQLNTSSPEALVSLHIEYARYEAVSFSELMLLSNLPKNALERILQSLMSGKTVIQTEKTDRRFIHRTVFEAFCTAVVEKLTAYHRSYPLKTGMPKGELRSKFPDIENIRLFNQMIEMMIKNGDIVQSEENIRLAGHQVKLATDETDLQEKIRDTYSKAGLQPPYFKDLCQSLDTDSARAKNILMHLVNEGKIIKVKEELFFDAAALRELQKRLTDFLVSKGEINTAQFKEMTGASRKYTIPLLEYFDANNITIRVGDVRKLRKKG